VIGIERATIIGHSLGGGVAMQSSNQFPQRTERLGLISSGGLGSEVGPLIRGAALPGVNHLLARRAPAGAGCALERRPADARPRRLEGRLPPGDRPRAAAARAAGARTAFVHTLRSVIDVHGQRGERSRPALPARSLPDADRVGERDRTIR